MAHFGLSQFAPALYPRTIQTNLQKWKRRLHLTGILLFCLSSGLTAATPTTTWAQDFPQEGIISTNASLSPRWNLFGRENGLISNTVLTILVVDDTVWFGTDAGISRFNGQWQSYPASAETFTGAVTTLIMKGQDLLAGTSTGHLLRWDGERWQSIYQAQTTIRSLAVLDQTVWIGAEEGILLWDGSQAVPLSEQDGTAGNPAIRSVTSISTSGGQLWVGTNQGLWQKGPEGWIHYTDADGLPSNQITALWLDPNSNLWIGTSQGVAHWQLAQDRRTTFLIAEKGETAVVISHITAAPDGSIWISGSTGVIQFDDDGPRFQLPGYLGLTTSLVNTVVPDRNGYLWLGTVAGVFRYEGSGWMYETRNPEEYTENRGVIFYGAINEINALLVDQNDTLWIATNGSGIRHKELPDQQNYERYYGTANGGLPSDVVHALAQTADGVIWAGTDQGLAQFEAGHWSMPPAFEALSGRQIRSLLAQDQDLWIGTAEGLTFLDRSAEQMTEIASLKDTPVNALVHDSAGEIWVGTEGKGLVHSDRSTWQHYTHENGLRGDTIVALAMDSSSLNGVWAAVSDHGVNHWDGANWQSYTTSEGLPSNVVHAINTAQSDASVWFGSEGGVTRFDDKTQATYKVQDGLLSTSITSIARTHGGIYWFGGQEGLTRYKPNDSIPWVQIASLAGPVLKSNLAAGQTSEIEITEQPLLVNLLAGDLHTNYKNLLIRYRLRTSTSPGEWIKTTEKQLTLILKSEGSYRLEVQVRDQDFNYSPIVKAEWTAFLPPAMIQLPIVGSVRIKVFQAFLGISLIALLGFLYVSYEILSSRAKTREAVRRGFNPYISGEPVRRADMFYGREEMLQRIIDTLHHNSIMIHGERRIGKTTLLYQLASRLKEVSDPDYWFVPIYFDLEGTPQEHFFHFLAEEIAIHLMLLPNFQIDQAKENLHFRTISPADYTDRDFSRDLRSLLALMTDYIETFYPTQRLRIILLMDEMDVMNKYDHLVQQQLRRIFMRDFASTLGAVVAGIQISKEWDRIESPWYNLFNEIELKPFDRELARELLIDPVQDIYQYDEAAIQAILDYSEGRPFRIQQYGLESVNHMLADKRRKIMLTDVETVHHNIKDLIAPHSNGLDDASAVQTAVEKVTS